MKLFKLSVLDSYNKNMDNKVINVNLTKTLNNSINSTKCIFQ